MVAVIFSFLFSWIVARLFGAESAGTIFFYITIITILVTIASQGADLGTAKAVARLVGNEQKQNGVLKSVVLKINKIYLILSPSILFFLLYEGYKRDSLFVLFVLMLILGYCFLYMNVLSFFYQGIGNVTMMILSQRTIFNLFSFILIAFLWGVFYLKNLNLSSMILEHQFVIVTIAGLISLGLLYLYHRLTSNHSKLYYKPDGFDSSCKELFRIQLLQIITMYGSQIIINIFSAKADIAGFIVAQRISTLLGFFVLAISGVISSQVSRAYSLNDITSVNKSAYHSVLFSTFLGVPVAGILILYSKECLLLFGDDFSKYQVVLIVLIVSQVFNCLTGACDIILMFIDGEKEHKKNVLIGTFFAIILSFILIPIYSALGAAIATALSAIIVNTLDVISIRKKAGFWIFKNE